MQPVQVIPFPPRQHRRAPASSEVAAADNDEQLDRDFLDLLSAYRGTGGLVTGAEIAARPPTAGFLALARNIAHRRVVSLVWREEIWLPVFQFEAGGQTVHAEVQVLIDELSLVLSDWELAKWFAAPNSWLDANAPVTLLPTDFARVHDAARALRFVHCN